MIFRTGHWHESGCARTRRRKSRGGDSVWTTNWTTQSANDRVGCAQRRLEGAALRSRLGMLKLEVDRAEDKTRRMMAGIEDDSASNSSSSSSSSSGSSVERKKRAKELQLQEAREVKLDLLQRNRKSLLVEMNLLRRVCSAFKQQSKKDVDKM
jgi:hypothetical protein